MTSCRKRPDPVPPVTTGSLKMEFSNIVGDRALNLDLQQYVNAAGDSFTVSTYKYYISNIVLNGADGNKYVEPNSYHLIDQATAASRKFKIDNVPVGDYTSVTFMIGVDSLHNSSGAQTGDLSPDKGMLWDWNTGYIMAKMEGKANTSTGPGKTFFLHISGYSGINSVLKTVTLPFPEKAIVSGDNIPNVHIFSDVQEWFRTPSTISFADFSNVMTVGKRALQIAGNYADMFVVDHVDN